LDGPFFVIQQHGASTLHFDLRLRNGDVLTSWAVPRGPSTDPTEKRLAVLTEDHPLAYGDFEGVVPEGEYGAGPVLIWDRGPYRNLLAEKEGSPGGYDLDSGLREGKIVVWLEGRKLRGGYALVHARVGGDDGNWLLVKMDDAEADARRNPVSTEPESVVSGRTLAELEDDQRSDGG
jgi:DNA ligase D-like protein (predicted 3'-phosphoesterase)